MPRKKNTTPAEDMTSTVNQNALTEAAEAVDVNAARLALVEQQLGADRPFSLEQSIDTFNTKMASAATEYIAAGLEIVRMKEHLQHGEFIQVVEERLGITRQTARNMMSVAVRFHNHLKLAQKLKPSALLELIHEEDEALEALEEGGTIAELELDDVAKMSVRDLRKTLRKERQKRDQEKEVHEKLLSKKDEKINELDAALSKREVEPRTWGDTVKALSAELEVTTGNALEAIDTLRSLREQILEVPADESDTAVEMLAVNFMSSLELILGHFGTEINDANAVFEGHVIAANERALNADASSE